MYWLLKQCFSGSRQASVIIRLHDARFSLIHDGCSLLRTLSDEFSLKTRAEGHYFRQGMVNSKFERTSSTSIRDVVHSVESEIYLYDCLVDTVNDSSLQSDLRLTDREKARILLLSCDNATKLHLQLHSGDDYASLRDNALKYYDRTFLVAQDYVKTPALSLSVLAGDFGEESIKDEQQGTFGSANPKVKAKPQKDGSSVECWKCGKRGHYARDCRSSSSLFIKAVNTP